MGGKEVFALILHIIAACICIVAAAAFLNEYTIGHYKTEIHAGYAPNARCEWKKGGTYYCSNALFFYGFALIVFGIIMLAFAVFEIGLAIKPDWFSFAESGIVRGVLYALVGIACLGCSGDLGIAGGSMLMIIGVVIFICHFFLK